MARYRPSAVYENWGQPGEIKGRNSGGHGPHAPPVETPLVTLYFEDTAAYTA